MAPLAYGEIRFKPTQRLTAAINSVGLPQGGDFGRGRAGSTGAAASRDVAFSLWRTGESPVREMPWAKRGACAVSKGQRGTAPAMYYLILIGSGVVIGLIVAAPIGPVNLICIRRTLAYGPVNGFFSGLGAALGDGVFAIVTGFGLTAISQWIEGYSTPIRFVGGLMLLGFGIHIFRTKISVLNNGGEAARDEGQASLVRTILSTFALTITNPATLFGFTALFTGLGSLAGGRPSFFEAAVTVGSVIGGSALWWFIITTIIGTFHRHIDDAVMRNINHFFGFAVTGFGIVVLGDLALKLF
jgi:threonine/homoserine/homoserine lactone efflux protein